MLALRGRYEVRPELRALAERVVTLGVERGVTVGTAESCTGGLVSGAVTAVAGSSAVLRGGVVSYDPEVKHDLLGVPQEIIDSVGVVSPECALAMCEGARDALSCDVAVSVTGIAGPGGAEPGKPVGTVWFGLATAMRSRSLVRHFEGSRDDVRIQAVEVALGLLCEGIAESAE